MRRRLWNLASLLAAALVLIAMFVVPAYSESTVSDSGCAPNDVACFDNPPEVTTSQTVWEVNGWRPVVPLMVAVALCAIASLVPTAPVGMVALGGVVIAALSLATMFFLLVPSVLLLCIGIASAKASSATRSLDQENASR